MRRFTKVAACVVAAMALVGTLCGCQVLNGSNSNYTPVSKSATISTPTIGQDGVLRVGVNKEKPPLAGQTSKIVGIDVDIAAAIADEFGLKVSIVDVGSDPAGALEKGSVDIVLGVDSTNTDSSIWKSDAYLQTGIALFALDKSKGLPSSADKSVKIAAQTTSMSAWSVTNNISADALVSEPDPKTAFADLSAKTVDYVAADAIIGTYSAYSSGLNVYIVGLLQQPGGYCVAVLDTNTQMKTQVSEIVDKLTKNGVISLIEKKWLGTSIDLTNTPVVATKATTTSTATTNTANTAVNAVQNASTN